MIIERQTIGRFMFQQASEIFGEISEYRECLLLERGPLPDDYTYYINLHKDPRFPQIDFRFKPDEKDPIKLAEYNSYEHRKESGQPLWRLHTSTIKLLVDRLHELTNVQSN